MAAILATEVAGLIFPDLINGGVGVLSEVGKVGNVERENTVRSLPETFNFGKDDGVPPRLSVEMSVVRQRFRLLVALPSRLP